MKRLVLIFENLYNHHLVKDVGQLPYLLGKYYNYSSTIACRKRDEYTHLDSGMQELQLDFTVSSYVYLLLNARTIDICMLFHIRAKSVYQGLLYKLLNPGGFLYIKADTTEKVLSYVTKEGRNPLAQTYNRFFFRWFVKKVDLVSFETRQVYEAIDIIPTNKKIYLPNGFDTRFPEMLGLKQKTYSEKKDLILCCARHGTEQKNSELLLDVLKSIQLPESWHVVFAGEVTKKFQHAVDQLKTDYPYLAHKVVLTGNISDRKQLYELYNEAKIFCLPSRWESWGLVCTEALYFGCALIMTREVISANDLTNFGEAGMLAGTGNTREWTESLQRLVSDPKLCEFYSIQGRNHFDTHFAWPDTLESLVKYFPSNNSPSL
jgi:glycosyltransferase involved in cell wall biosynthesis